jgi:hypothetical protein
MKQLILLIKNNLQIALLFVAFLILFPLGLFGLKNMSPKTTPLNTINQTMKQSNNNQEKLSPAISSTLSINPSVDPEKKLIDLISNRRKLSFSDQTAKTYLKSLLPAESQSGFLYESSKFNVEYINSPDLFKVEILNTDITSVKEQAVLWFKSKGFSQEGICNLPLSFYLNFDISKQIKDTQGVFNPLPEGC